MLPSSQYRPYKVSDAKRKDEEAILNPVTTNVFGGTFTLVSHKLEKCTSRSFWFLMINAFKLTFHFQPESVSELTAGPFILLAGDRIKSWVFENIYKLSP